MEKIAVDRSAATPVGQGLRAWSVLLAALGSAGAGAGWAILRGDACPSCASVGHFALGGSLPVLGLLTYAALLGTALLGGPRRAVYLGVLIAAGVQAGLLAILYHLRSHCLPCLATAGASGVALGAAIACDRSNAFRASILVPGAALLVEVGALVGGELPLLAVPSFGTKPSVREDGAERESRSGTATLLAYIRPDCGYCIDLERDVLPEIIRSYGSRLVIERRSAEDLPGLPTPTLILTCGPKRRIFPGLPDLPVLRNAIETMLGDAHDP